MIKVPVYIIDLFISGGNDMDNISVTGGNRDITKDKRKCRTPVISRYTFFGGKRKTIRRVEDRTDHLFVDLYSTRLLVVILLLLGLSCLDAYLTLTLIDHGKAVEANPLMAYFLAYGRFSFTVMKIVITASALLMLCLFKNVNITRIGVPLVIKIYLAVIIYEFYLFTL